MDEVVRLLKSKGIQLPGRGSQLDEEEKTKRKLFAKYERRKRRQTERHVLRKEMAVHAIPQLFVSQRMDKSPNGFNCAICQKDISFLSRGAPEIWRHFSRKSHYLKDRRYRLDHEDVFYTPKFDAVEVATVSAELRAEIEETPPVTLGKKNLFREDEVDALVGVVSNVPSATLVGGYLSFSVVVVPIVSCDVFGTSSVLPSQSSRPMRRLRGVKLSPLSLSFRRYILVFFVECKDSVFSVLFREEGNGVNCIVRCQVDGRVREVCLLWEPYGTGICDAEIRCLSRVLSILTEGQSPVALFGCSSTLFNVFSEW